ncbi:MAG: pseudouridylate synthase [Proteobacteria bacterium]|nr:pseudouridylate synthase [Pseudomonadota bacterium]
MSATHHEAARDPAPASTIGEAGEQRAMEATRPLRVLYEDASLVAIAKPAGAVVHRTRGAAEAPILISMLSDQLGARVFPLHRLDRQTSGVMVFARSSTDAARLAEDLRAHRWRKTYLALCRGPLRSAIEVDHPVPEGEKRRPARTCFEPLETFCGRFTLARATPLTGRRHQVRYHCKHLRHPIVGDTNYGQGPINRFFRETFSLHRLFLHAESLELTHPRRLATIAITCPLDQALQDVLSALRAHSGPVP